MAGDVGVMVLVKFSRMARLDGFIHLAFGRYALRNEPGITFFKTLGSGRDAGFGLTPSASHQGLFAAFADEAAADHFLEGSRTIHFLRFNSDEVATIKLRAYSSRGAWAGVEPLRITAERPAVGPVASLTRASIRMSTAMQFWRHAPPSELSLKGAEGCLLSAGLGEAPLFRQATFTVWDSERSMSAFARLGAHADAIRDAQQRGLFTESLFARFVPYQMTGTWLGRDLAQLGAGTAEPPGGRGANLTSRSQAAPALKGDQRPDRFDHAERPRALQEPIDRRQHTRSREGEHVPRAPRFQRIGYEHQGHGEQAEQRQRIEGHGSACSGKVCS